MTTTIKVSAHCDKDTTEVTVIEGGTDKAPITTTLQDGEEKEFFVHDDNHLAVAEVAKHE